MTSRVVLRSVIEPDLPIFYEQQIDPDATRLAAFPARNRRDFMTHWSKLLADDAVLKRTILLDGQVAGNVVSWTDLGDRLVGFWLGQDYWGKGVATAALTAFLTIEPARPLYAYVAAHNLASRRVLAKCGFVPRDQDAAVPLLKGDGAEPVVMVLR